MTLLDRAFVKAFDRRPHFSPLPQLVREDLVAVPTAPWSGRPRPDEGVRTTPTEEQPTTVPLNIAWRWPTKSQSVLAATRDGFERLAEQLVEITRAKDLRSIGFVSPGRGHGRTTTMLALTEILVACQSAQVLLVDADFGHPEIAMQLSATPSAGLWEMACGDARLDEAVVELVPKRLGLLAECRAGHVGQWHSGLYPAALRALAECRQRCELVLIDAGPLGPLSWSAEWNRDVVDAVVSIGSTRPDRPGVSDRELVSRLVSAGIEYLGQIETFV
jgi:Mrp family chromosome partitioning ATPase